MSSAELLTISKPDPDTMREHLEFLFGGAIHGFQDGLIELAWTDPRPNEAGLYPLRHAQLYGTDKTDDLVEKACRLNANAKTNVYIGAALRHPHTAPFGRTTDADFFAATAMWADLDDPASNSEAKNRFTECRPSFVVCTGRTPTPRHQLWWRLSEPVTDPAEVNASLRGIAKRLQSDPTVTNPGRIMRLAGSIAWDVKDGRVPELTSVVTLKTPGDHSYHIEQINQAYPPDGEGQPYSVAPHEHGPDVGIVRQTNSLGLDIGKVVDGREKYMRDVLCAVLVEMIATTQKVPTSDVLCEAAWPIYEQNTDLSRAGRNRPEFAMKARSTLNRFSQGKIKGARDIQEATESYRARQAADAAKFRGGEGRSTFSPFDAANIDLRVDPETGEVFNASTGQSAASPADPLPDVPNITAEAKKRISLIPWGDLADEPVRWLVDGLLPAKSFSAIYGRPGSYKSFLALYIGAMIGCGRPVFGKATVAGDVVYIAGEGGAGLKRRRDALIEQHGITEPVRMHFLKAQLNLRSTDADLIALLQEMASMNIKPCLIIIDTLARAFAGGNENAPEDMGAFISIIGAMQEATGAAVMVVHHSGKDEAKGLRGHSSLLGAVDTELECKKTSSEESQERKGILSVTKQKDGEDGYGLNFEMALINLSQIDPTKTSLAVVPVDGDVAATGKRRRVTPNDMAAFKALEAAIGEAGESVGIPQVPSGKRVVKTSLWRNFFLSQSLDDEKGQEQARKAFRRSSERLLSHGTIGTHAGYCWISEA